MNEQTFGSTPAALYLARTLIELDDQSLNRAVGRRITGTTSAVNDLVGAYERGFLPVKTVANCLRLMREEVTNEQIIDVAYYMGVPANPLRSLVDKLRRNVQIGAIKRGIRLCQIARKSEHIMTKRRGLVDESGTVYFRDSQSGCVFEAGKIFKYMGVDINAVRKFNRDEVSEITPELLMERSNRRCKRLNKPHMKDAV